MTDMPLTLAQHTLASGPEMNGYFMLVIMTIVVGVIAVLSIAIGIPARVCMQKTREREKTKREIAAYVAEGSITPEEGAKMIKAAERGGAKDWFGNKA